MRIGTFLTAITILLSSPLALALPAILMDETVMKDSMATLEQLEPLKRTIEAELRSKRSDRESLEIINAQLARLQLPQIELNSPDLDIKVVSSIGFASSNAVGARIVDGKYKFCLPCTQGRNWFVFGIVPWEKSKREPKGRFYKTIERLDAIGRDKSFPRSIVNSWNWPAKRWALIPVQDSEGKGVLLLHDDSAEFFEVPFPSNNDAGRLGIPARSTIKSQDGELISLQIRGIENSTVEETLPHEKDGGPIDPIPIPEERVHRIIENALK